MKNFFKKLFCCKCKCCGKKECEKQVAETPGKEIEVEQTPVAEETTTAE